MMQLQALPFTEMKIDKSFDAVEPQPIDRGLS